VYKSQAGAVFLSTTMRASLFTDLLLCLRTSGADKLWWNAHYPWSSDPWKFTY